MKTFHFLHYGLAVILSFVGIKMLIADFYKIQTGLSLAVIAAVLALSIIASLIRPVKDVLADEKNEITVQHGE